MKVYIDRLRDMPIEHLKEEIRRQKLQIEIKERDLQTMENVLDEKEENDA